MVDDVVAVLRAEDHRDHVAAEELPGVLGLLGAPSLALRRDLAYRS
jgi:hypothetical protein